MTKQQQIEERMNKPFEVGDIVDINIDYEENEPKYEGKGKKRVLVNNHVKKTCSFRGKIINKIDDNIFEVFSENSPRMPIFITHRYEKHGKIANIHKCYMKHDFSDLGANPFVEYDWNAKITFYQSDIEHILWRIGYDRRERKYKFENIEETVIPELDWNPTIINEKGEEVVYQRDFCWSLQEKQLLIDSIYNHIEIGKVVVRLRSFSWVENRIKRGIIEHTTFKQIVDGKQRCNTILGFINNEFPDSYGNYWNDLSSVAQRKFFSFRQITYGELGETSNDKDVLNTFLCINHAGKPMSPEHLEYVKSIKV